jgi:type IV secretion system protein VirB4
MTPAGRCSEPLEFLSCLYNGEMRPVLMAAGDAGDTCRTAASASASRRWSCRAPAPWRAASGPWSRSRTIRPDHAGMLDDLLRLPCEMVVTQSFGFVDRQPAWSG